MSETSEEIRQEAVNSCLFVLIIRSKNSCFVSKKRCSHSTASTTSRLKGEIMLFNSLQLLHFPLHMPGSFHLTCLHGSLHITWLFFSTSLDFKVMATGSPSHFTVDSSRDLREIQQVAIRLGQLCGSGAENGACRALCGKGKSVCFANK